MEARVVVMVWATAARVEVMVVDMVDMVDMVDKLVRTTEDLEAARVEELVSSARAEAARVEVMVAGWAPRVDKLVRTTAAMAGSVAEEMAMDLSGAFRMLQQVANQPNKTTALDARGRDTCVATQSSRSDADGGEAIISRAVHAGAASDCSAPSWRTSTPCARVQATPARRWLSPFLGLFAPLSLHSRRLFLSDLFLESGGVVRILSAVQYR